MYRRLLLGALLVAGAAAIAAAPSRSSAESRLFSVRTDQEGVTIVEAIRAGKDLPVAGQNGGQTFFRIDNPAGAVPCVNSIRFVGSNGQAVDAAVDLCANNWDLTVAVGTAPPSPSPSPSPTASSASAPQSLPLAAGTIRPVAIATDDPNVTITDVFLSGAPVAIAARQDPYVQVNLVAGAQGLDCSRDIGLVLSDGRRVARQVDVCSTNFVVFIPLVGGVTAPPLPANMRPSAAIQPLPPAPALTQAPPAQPAPPPVPATGTAEAVASSPWTFTGGTQGTLAYGAEFTATCQPASGRAAIALGRTAGELGPTGKVWVTFTAGAFSKAYSATGGAVSAADNLSHPTLTLSVGDPLWAPLIREKTVAITIGSTPAYSLPLSGSAPAVKQFLIACSPAVPAPAFVQAPPPSPPPPQGQSPAATDVPFLCNDGSYISATFGTASATVYEPDYPPLTLPEVPFNGDGREFATGRAQLVGQGEDIYWSRDGSDGRTCRRG